jgi:hypothetical protein
VRVGPDGVWLATEAVTEVVGAFRVAEPAPIEVRRLGDGRVLVSTTAAIEIDAAWAGSRPRGVSVLEHDDWHRVGELDRPGVVDADLVERLQAHTGHRSLWLLLDGG